MVRGGCKRPLSSAFDELPFHSRGGAAGACLSNPTRALPTVTLRAETRRKGGVRGGVDENRRAINQRNLAMPPSRARRCGSHGENVDRRHQIWTRSQTHSAVARPADWLLGSSVVTPAASSCRPVPTFPMRAQMAFSKPDHPLFSPVVDGTTIQKAANARRVSVFLCVPPRSPKSSASRTQVYLFWHWHFVLVEHASCHLPNISSCPPFLPFLPQLLPELQENGTVSVRLTQLSIPQYHSHMVLPRFKPYYRIQSCIQQSTTAGIFPPGVPCGGRESFRESSDFLSSEQRSTALI